MIMSEDCDEYSIIMRMMMTMRVYIRVYKMSSLLCSEYSSNLYRDIIRQLRMNSEQLGHCVL